MQEYTCGSSHGVAASFTEHKLPRSALAAILGKGYLAAPTPIKACLFIQFAGQPLINTKHTANEAMPL
jgi:hypothetical protein